MTDRERKKRGKTTRGEQEECKQAGGRERLNDRNRGEKSGLNDWVREVKEEERWHSSACRMSDTEDKKRVAGEKQKMEDHWNPD